MITLTMALCALGPPSRTRKSPRNGITEEMRSYLLHCSKSIRRTHCLPRAVGHVAARGRVRLVLPGPTRDANWCGDCAADRVKWAHPRPVTPDLLPVAA